MAMAYFGRALISKFTVTSPMARPFASSSPSAPSFVRSSSPLRSSSLICLRPLIALKEFNIRPAAIGIRCFSTRPTTSSLNDPSPNWSNRPPKETILLDGCDFEHWLVVMEPPEGNPTRDEIIDSYIKTLANVVGSEDEAKMKIYSVSTRHYFAFGALVSEELSYKIKTLPRVRWVLPDSYLDVKNKDYGGEPFIDGKAVPYDPKYHEEWVRNNARANERSRRNDRPRNFDRSRNFERRRENMQNRDFQNNAPPPMPNSEAQHSTPFRDGPGVSGGMPNRDAVPNTQYMNRDVPNPGTGMRGMPNRDFQSQGMPPNKDLSGMPNRGYQSQGMGGMPSSGYQNPGGAQGIPNSGYQNQGVGSMPNSNYPNPGVGGMPNNGYQNQGNYQGSPGNYQGSPGNYQSPGMGGTPNRDYAPNSYVPNRDTGGTSNRDYSSNSYTPNRDMGGRDY